VTIAKIFDFKGLTSKILKAQELARAFGAGQRSMGYLVLINNSCKIEGCQDNCARQITVESQPFHHDFNSDLETRKS
jgi:hypothetical protein